MEPDDAYAGREQSLVKHQVLRTYLSRFAPIVLSTAWHSITYVDCFSGPWNAQTKDLRDTSFAIAVDELRKARDLQRKHGRNPSVRCFFLEKDREAYVQLKAFADAAQDIDIETRNAVLEDSVNAIVDFVQRGGRSTFPFIFIDPTGWTGFEIATIAPLLALKPCEVLINLMTKDVSRFVGSPEKQTQESFERLFGRRGIEKRVEGTQGLDRDDVVIEEYGRSVREAGGFPYVCTAIVLHPERDRTHFHLIYATRDRKGVEVFKEAEKKAMATQEAARAIVEERRRQRTTGMASMFDSESMHNPAYYDLLRHHYVSRSRGLVQHLLESKGRVPYEEVWDTAMAQPLTWPSDLKDWLSKWKAAGRVSHEGWKPRQLVPHLDSGNVVVWS